MTLTEPRSTAYAETPAFFRAGQESLFGVLCAPVGSSAGITVVVAPGGWYGTACARNRLLVRLSRTLAAGGTPCFSFEYRGVGESTGRARFELTAPFVDDLRGAVAWVRERGARRCILMGVCFGGWTALSLAPEVSELEGVVLVALPMSDDRRSGAKRSRRASEVGLGEMLRRGLRPWTIRGLLDRDLRHSYALAARAKKEALLGRSRRAESAAPGSSPPGRVSPAIIAGVEHLARRGVPLLFVYGSRDHYHREFRAAREGRLQRALERAGAEVVTPAADVQSFATVATQDAVIAAVVAGVSRWRERR